jgi:hypothetical protein
MSEEKSQTNQEAAAEKVDDELFRLFCKKVGLSADQVTQIVNAPDEPGESRRINARR